MLPNSALSLTGTWGVSWAPFFGPLHPLIYIFPDADPLSAASISRPSLYRLSQAAAWVYAVTCPCSNAHCQEPAEYCLTQPSH